MRCCLKFGGIIQFWHCILILSLQSYVLIRSILGYLKLRSQIFNARHGLDWDSTPLNFFVNCIVLSAAFTIIMAFLLCAHRDYFFLGSFPINSSQIISDSRNSGNFEDLSNRTVSLTPEQKKRSAFVKNGPVIVFPLAFLFHVMAAFCLLLPTPWVIGEQAKNEAIDPNLAWQTDLSFIFPILSPKDVMQNTLVRHPDLATKLASSGLLSTRLTGSTLLAVQPPTLGGIGQLPQTKQQEGAVANLKTAIIQHSSGVKTTFNDAATAGIRLRPPSFEIVNFFLALAFLAIRIAATFWTVWPTFSYLSSVLLIFTGVYLTFEYAAVSLLVQLTVCLTPHFNSTNIFSSLIIVRLPMQLTPWQTILSTSIAFFITLGSFGVLFHLAIRQFNKVLRENYYTVANMLGMAERQTNGASEALVTSPPWSETNSLERKEGSTKCHRSPLRGRPLIVLGFLSLVATTLVRMPCLYDMFQLYWSEKDYLCLTTIVLFVCVHMAWLMMWFGFAMKQKWTFHVKYSPAMQQSQLSNQESSFRNTYLSEPAVPGPIKFPQMQEFNDEAPFELSCPNSTYVYFSPLQLQNPGVPAQEPTLLPSVTNGFKQPLRVPPPPESSASQVMTNVLYAPAASNQKAATSENEPFLLRGPFLLTPPSLKYASIRRSKLWDAETNGKQEVVVDVAETAPPTRITRSPRTISSETAVDNEIRPQSVPPLSIGEVDNNLLKVAPIAVQESGHSTTSSGDRICSQV